MAASHPEGSWEIIAVSSEPGPAMAELQEVQITEDKPLLDDPLKAAELAARILLDQEQKHSIETPYGVAQVTIHGTPKPKRPAIITFHDVGLNHKSCFETLFKYEDMHEIVKNFMVCHIDAPGQEEGAAAFPVGYQYPSLDQLAEMITCVLQFLNLGSIIGIGVGAGAYVLARYTLNHPDTVEGLVLINIDPNAKGWMDWAAHKLTGLTSSISEMILGHLFSSEEISNNTEAVRQYKETLTNSNIVSNHQLYFNSYNNRRDLNIERGGEVTLKCPVMLVVGDQAPHEDAVVECNSKLDPTQTSFLKMADSGGQPQITQPSKLTEAFKYFVQGMGYMASSCMTRLSRSRTASLSSAASGEGNRSRSRTMSQSSESGQFPPGQSQTMEVSC
ncbi:protein NDRG2 isoform X2 [Rhinatrema bivittatum]|uniref:protein NDRG2 isoform X2 n=1 Tax=Rhinatrema bivittatum TaxID=194408 RepID=UPI0011264DBC|nr:protein NDRG2 isoform X2 [Rhinatrema bivittatum]